MPLEPGTVLAHDTVHERIDLFPASCNGRRFSLLKPIRPEGSEPMVVLVRNRARELDP